LIDPEKTKPDEAVALAKEMQQYGTAAIMVGGSTIASTSLVDEIILALKNRIEIPTILFPNHIAGVSKYADAMWFMSLLNSNNPLYITGFQALAALTIKNIGIEAIPLAYLIVGTNSTAAYVGQAHIIPHQAAEIATGYALAAEYMGMRFVYLEAGSGAKKPVSSKMVTMVKKSTSIPVIVGGGIKEPGRAEALAKAGADAIVTGTVLEDNESRQRIKDIIMSIRDVNGTQNE
jgi:phosphoglycerol geranylgeranyltransferase